MGAVVRSGGAKGWECGLVAGKEGCTSSKEHVCVYMCVLHGLCVWMCCMLVIVLLPDQTIEAVGCMFESVWVHSRGVVMIDVGTPLLPASGRRTLTCPSKSR